MNVLMAQWRPAQVRVVPSPMVGQQAVSNPPGTVLVPVRPAFIDSPVIQLTTDVAAAVSMGMLGHSFGKVPPHGSRWSTVFWVFSALAGFKALYDLSKLNR